MIVFCLPMSCSIFSFLISFFVFIHSSFVVVHFFSSFSLLCSFDQRAMSISAATMSPSSWRPS
jgi:hypothetical protein